MEKVVVNKASSPNVIVRDLSLMGSDKTKQVVSYLINDKQKHSAMPVFCNIRAFTLIELLVVVLIIGILAAIALPQYEKTVEKSRAAEAVVNMRTLKRAIDVWILENGFPSHHSPIFLSGEDTGDTPLDVEVNGRTKYFNYSAYCEDEQCLAGVTRNYGTCFASASAVKSASTNIWEERCYYEKPRCANLAKAFCSAFDLEAEQD